MKRENSPSIEKPFRNSAIGRKLPALCLLLLFAFALQSAIPSDAKRQKWSPWWMMKHQLILQRPRTTPVDLLFIGDSITEGWAAAGKAIWDKEYAPLHAANFGISGDVTDFVLWRTSNGELEGIKPKVVVLLIGTNNVSRGDKPERIAAQIGEIVTNLRARLPMAKILLVAIFPRDPIAGTPGRKAINQVNSLISRLDDGHTVRFLDIGNKLLGSNGQIPFDVMPDFLHPSEKGYQIWANSMRPLLQTMMK